MKKFYIYLFIIPLILFSCVGEVDDVFDTSASHRMEATLAEYRELLTSSENGWLADYYPEKNYAVGGSAMYFNFTKDGKASISSESETNVPMGEVAISDWDLIAEQGPVLAFMTYNPVLHYFSEPNPNDINGQQADYEFVVIEASKDTIVLSGKRFKNELVLRRNTENVDPKTYFEENLKTYDASSDYGMFKLVEDDEMIASCAVIDRTFSAVFNETEEKGRIPYAFTPTGIRLSFPFVFDGKTMQNFEWDNAGKKYVCTDPGVNVYFESYFPDDYQLKFSDFVGKWKMRFNGASTSVWVEETVEITEKKKNVSLLLYSPNLFSFVGLTLSFDAQKGTISLLGQNAGIHEPTGYMVRVLSYARSAGYVNSNLGQIGLFGEWNEDAGGERKITFVDNGQWVTYSANGILLRLYNGTTNIGNFTQNIADYRFSSITLTKISD